MRLHFRPCSTGHEPTPALDPVFPRMELVLRPQTWCFIKPTQAWKAEVPWAAPKAQQFWGWRMRVGHPSEQHPGAGRDTLFILLGTPVCSLAKSLFVRPFLVVRG